MTEQRKEAAYHVDSLAHEALVKRPVFDVRVHGIHGRRR